MKKTTLSLLAITLTMSTYAQRFTLTSPNGEHSISIESQHRGERSELHYSTSFRGKPVVTDGTMGLDMNNHTWEMALGKRTLPQYDCWMDAMQVDSAVVGESVHRNWHNAFGERSTVEEHYAQGTVYLSRHDDSHYRINVEVRAYNEGVAYRYFLPEHKDAIFHKVTANLTSFHFPQGTMAWSEQWAQGKSELAIQQASWEMPFTMKLPSGHWASILRADVDDWCLEKMVAGKDLWSISMYSPVDVVTYFATPWYIIMAAETAGQLVEHNDIVQNLNPPCAIPDAEQWVKPGTIMRCTTLNTQAAMECIDFCEKQHIPYMLFDWKWYEPCTSHDGDATQVIPAIDMPKVVAYGREHGVGIWLYVNQHALMKQARELFPLLHEWGIVGVKSGFVQYASHRWATWLHDLVRLAADNHLMMNIHDEFRPNGFSRTYPNLLTQEGIHGNEEWPDATQDCHLPFTRMLCGPADYTICYYDKRLQNTHGHQLAASLTYFSPLTTIFWYDTPQRSHGEPELEWFRQLPTTWDETRILAGSPGECVITARRKASTWYIAVLGNNEARTITLPLTFLEKGQRYTAYLYEDDATVQTATHVRCSQRSVTSRTTLTLPLSPRGGAALRCCPQPK